MRRFAALALLVALAACDSGTDPVDPTPEPFSLTVAVRDAGGQPVPDASVAMETVLAIRENSSPAGTVSFFVAPSPFQTSARVIIDVPEPAPLDLVLLDIAGQPVGTLAAGDYEAGTYSFQIDREDSPAGLYRVRATVGEQAGDRWIYVTDAFEGNAQLIRVLGETGPDGTLRFTDRTLAQGLYDAPGSVLFIDDTGSVLGEIGAPTTAVRFAVGDAAPIDVMLVDGPNEVEIVVP